MTQLGTTTIGAGEWQCPRCPFRRTFGTLRGAYLGVAKHLKTHRMRLTLAERRACEICGKPVGEFADTTTCSKCTSRSKNAVTQLITLLLADGMAE